MFTAVFLSINVLQKKVAQFSTTPDQEMQAQTCGEADYFRKKGLYPKTWSFDCPVTTIACWHHEFEGFFTCTSASFTAAISGR